MKVVVTGSSGKVGHATMAALKAAGHRAIGFDMKSGEGHSTVPVDIGDFGAVIGALSGIDAIGGVPDAVIHLAAYPAPGLAPDQRIFEHNAQSTYNIFSACARLGIKRVVWASSETVLGLPFSAEMPPAFAPVDEDQPDRPAWSYSLSKQIGETMADAFVRWHPGMTILSLRFSYVQTREDYPTLLKMRANPKAPQFNLWSYVDAEDCGTACRLATEADLAGHHHMIIAAADNMMGRPSADLLREYLPDVPIRGTIEGEQSLLSSARAKALIGYAPRFSWRDRT
jgi:nucleoside-diphosphate-sugar epimerase